MTEHVDAGTSMDLARYVSILRRRWRVVAGLVVLGFVVSVLYLVWTPQKLTAATLVQINVITTEPFAAAKSSADLVDGQTEVQLARSSPVLSEASEQLTDSLTPADLRAGAEVTLLPDTTVVRIAYTAGSKREATTAADTIAEAYLAFRAEEAADRIDTITKSLETRRTDVLDRLRDANRRLSGASAGSSVAIQAETDRQTLSADLESLSGQINSLNAIETDAGTVLTRAEDGAVTVSPRRAPVLLAGLFGGLLLGIVAAFVVNVLDRRVRDPYDVSGAGGGVVLTRLTSLRGTLAADAADDDAIRSLRERLLASLPAEHPVLSVIEVNRGHEQFDLHVKLARSVASGGLPVELIMPEHSPEGLRALRAGLHLKPFQESDNWSQLQTDEARGLTVTVASSEAQGTAAADLVSERLRSGASESGLTMIALPPDASRSLRLASARLGHAVILVVSDAETRIDQLARLATELRAVGAVVHGSVMVPRGRHTDFLVDRASPSGDTTEV